MTRLLAPEEELGPGGSDLTARPGSGRSAGRHGRRILAPSPSQLLGDPVRGLGSASAHPGVPTESGTTPWACGRHWTCV